MQNIICLAKTLVSSQAPGNTNNTMAKKKKYLAQACLADQTEICAMLHVCCIILDCIMLLKLISVSVQLVPSTAQP